MSRAGATVLSVVVGLTVAAVVVGVVVTGFDLNSPAPDALGRNEIASNGEIQGDLYTGSPKFEAELVRVEDERIDYLRKVISAAQWGDIGTDGPYRVSTGTTFTLMLTPREEPYLVADLLELAPDTFVSLDEHSYLLTEHIAVLEGAELSLNSDTDLTIRLASDSSGFVSIVSLGGQLTVAGSEASTVVVESWDAALGKTDVRTDDGRAYVRVLGGQATLADSRFADLGFWSGNTGGLSLTGNDALGTFEAVETVGLAADAKPDVAGATLLPAGALAEEIGSTDASPLVSATIDNVEISGNAFGLFVSSAVNVVVRGSAISNSLVDGLVFHRYVSDSSVTDTTSVENAVDGFSVGRSTTGVVLAHVSASHNGRNGISIDGQPLADGPSAVGTEVVSYGHNGVTDSTLTYNGRYGIEVSGGREIELADNTLSANQVGVVLNSGAVATSITGNRFGAHEVQSLAVRDGVTKASVTDNTFVGGDTAVYVRNAEASITGNDISSMSNHGITIVGTAGSVTVAGNSVSGDGNRAIFDRDAIDLSLGENNLAGWRPAIKPATLIAQVFQPLTLIWLALAAMLILTAIGPRSLRFGSFRHPYADRLPLQSFSHGVVPRHSLDRAPE